MKNQTWMITLFVPSTLSPLCPLSLVPPMPLVPPWVPLCPLFLVPLCPLSLVPSWVPLCPLYLVPPWSLVPVFPLKSYVPRPLPPPLVRSLYFIFVFYMFISHIWFNFVSAFSHVINYELIRINISSINILNIFII